MKFVMTTISTLCIYTYLNQQSSNLIMANCYVHIDKLVLQTTIVLLVHVDLVCHSIEQDIASILSLLSSEPAHLQLVVGKIQNQNQKSCLIVLL